MSVRRSSLEPRVLPDRSVGGRSGAAKGASSTGKSKATGFPATDKVERKSVFAEGVTYRSTFGFRHLFGACSIVKLGSVYHFEVPIRFVGALGFAAASPAMARKWGNVADAPSRYFKAGATSIAQIPALKDRLLEIIATVEEALATDFCRVHLTPSFPDERTIADKSWLQSEKQITRDLREAQVEPTAAAIRDSAYKGANMALIEGIKAKTSPANPIIIQVLAVPNPTVITPTAWDPYSNPLLIAHEVAHCLGVDTEGYELADYPANGLMKDETGMTVLQQMTGKSPKLLRTDFNELMQKHAAKASPTVDGAAARREFKDTSGSRYTRGVDWMALSPARRLTLAKAQVAALGRQG
ncbi:MAG: hypothetical protein HY903_09505 [Deltaproteobacteria bacterium]|nr:hypothetical protein [Deltaproteobacteria bacterium]